MPTISNYSNNYGNVCNFCCTFLDICFYLNAVIASNLWLVTFKVKYTLFAFGDLAVSPVASKPNKLNTYFNYTFRKK